MSRKTWGIGVAVVLFLVLWWAFSGKSKPVEEPAEEPTVATEPVETPTPSPAPTQVQAPPAQAVKPVAEPKGKQILEGICTMDCCPETRSDKVLEETPLRAGPDMTLPVLTLVRTDDVVRSMKSYYVIDGVGVGRVTQAPTEPQYQAIKAGDRLHLIAFVQDTMEKFWHGGREYTARNGVGISWEVDQPPQNPQDWLFVRTDADLEGWVLRGLAGFDWSYESCR